MSLPSLTNGKRILEDKLKQQAVPYEAYLRYIELEHRWENLNEANKKCKDRFMRDNYAKKKKQIRTEQNLLFPEISRNNMTRELAKELGLRFNTPYIRYIREFGYLHQKEGYFKHGKKEEKRNEFPNY